MMNQKYYATDTCFYSSMGVYSFEDRCEMTKAAGYDATTLSVWDGLHWSDVSKLQDIKSRFDLDVAAIYVVLNLAVGVKSGVNQGIYDMLKAVPEGSTIELAIKTAGHYKPSDPQGDEAVIDWLKEALIIAEVRHLQILIYPHFTHWSEQHADAVRLCERINHPHLGIVFCGYHWYAADGRQLATRLNMVRPWLRQVNLSGSRRSPLGWGRMATIESIDQGEMDNFSLIAQLNRIGYSGYLGYQGWDEGGDPFQKLQRSLIAMKGMKARALKYPHWAKHII